MSVPARSQHTDKMSPKENGDTGGPGEKQPQQKSQEGPGDSTPAATEINEGDQPLLEHRDTVTTNDSSKNVPDSTGDAQTSVGTHGVSNSAQLPCIVSGDAL